MRESYKLIDIVGFFCKITSQKTSEAFLVVSNSPFTRFEPNLFLFSCCTRKKGEKMNFVDNRFNPISIFSNLSDPHFPNLPMSKG